MNFTTEHHDDIAVVRVQEARMMYPILGDFAATVTGLVQDGTRKMLIDLTPVTYIDSATIGCLMDLYRQIHAVDGVLKLAGVQRRVETMLTMTGAQNFIEVHADAEAALTSFGA